MKLILCSLFLILSLNSVMGLDKSISYLVDDIKHPSCNGQNNCTLFLKVKAFFPTLSQYQPKNGEKPSPSDINLNEFNYKYIYLFDSYLSIFKSTNQNEKVSTPSMDRFLNNIQLDNIYTPCENDMQVCTVQQYVEQIVKPRGQTFKVPETVEINMNDGKIVSQQCLIIQLNMVQENQFGYICVRNAKQFQALQYQLSKNIRQNSFKENHKLSLLDQQTQNWEVQKILIDNDKIVVAKDPYAVPENKTLANLQRTNNNADNTTYYFIVDLNERALQYYDLDGKTEFGKLKVQGQEACVLLPLKSKSQANDRQYLTYCQRDKKLNLFQASLSSKQFSNEFNRLLRYKQAQVLKEFLSKKNKNDNNSTMSEQLKLTIQSEILYFKQYIETGCVIQSSSQMRTKEECDAMKAQAIETRIKEICLERVFCMAIARTLQNHRLDEKLNFEEFSITKEYFQRALNTLRIGITRSIEKKYEQSKSFPDVSQSIINQICYRDIQILEKAMYLPFVSEEDPWLKFFQYIHQNHNQV